LGSDLAVRLIIAAQDATGGAVRSAREGIQSISTTASQVFGALKGYLTYKINVEGAAELLSLGDKYEGLKARIKLVSDSTAEFTTAQSALFDIAQKTRSDLESVVTVYGKTEKAVKALGGSQKDSLDLSQLIAESFKVSGAAASETAGGIQQLSQALSSGVLRGDEFNSVMENAPRLAQALAAGLDIPIGRLRTMAEAGELTADKVVKALLTQKEAIARDYAQIPQTVEGAMTQARNSLLRYVGELNASTGITQRVAGFIKLASDHLSELAQVAGVVAAVMGGNLAKSMLAYGAAQIQSIQATRAQAASAVEARAAALALAEGKVAELRATVASTEAMLAETVARGTYIRNLELEASLTKALATQKLALREAETSLATASAAGATSTSLLTKAMGALNLAIAGVIAADVGWAIGSWLRQFETARLAGTALAESVTELQYRIANVKLRFTDADAFDRGVEKIRQEYREIADSTTDFAQKTAAANDKQKQAAAAADAATSALTKQAESLKEVAARTDALVKLSEIYTAGIDSSFASRESMLKSQIASATASVQEAEAGGKHIEALKAEGEAIAAAGALKQTEIEHAQAMVAAKEGEARAAQDNLAAITQEAQASGAMSDKSLVAIATAQQDAAAKRQAADAARLHVTELMRLPPTLAGATSAQALHTAAVRAAYIETTVALQKAKDLKAAHLAGTATEQQAAAAAEAFAVSNAKLAQATAEAAVADKKAKDTAADRADTMAILTQAEERETEAARARQDLVNSERESLNGLEGGLDGVAGGQDNVNQSSDQAISLYGEVTNALERYNKGASAAMWEELKLSKTFELDYKILARFADMAQRAADQLARNTDAASALNEALASGTNVAGAMAAAMAELSASGDLLDKQNLAGLQQALDAAKAKMDSLRDSATATLQTLQDELYQLQGNARASEQLHYQQTIDELNKKLAEAQKAGNTEAVQQLRDAMALEEEIHRRKMANIAAEQAAAAKAKQEAAAAAAASARTPVHPVVPATAPTVPSTSAAPATSAAPPTKVRVEFAAPDGSTVAGDFSEAGAAQIVSLLRKAGARATGGLN